VGTPTPPPIAPAGTPTPNAPPRDPNAPPVAQPGTATPGAPTALISVTSGPEFRIAGGPYTVPLAINNAQRVSVLSLSVTFNPGVLRVRTVQDGTFMRQGGASVSFTPRIDVANGRVDIAVARTGDQTGASGTGLLAALLFDAIGPGSSTIQVSGVASTPEGGAINLQFSPVTVTVR
jgi:general secretion pathway protein D